ncbi:hypothetical protein NPIL_77231 [Nephila pilipes]|uniref:Uncharacterized protein n=1 Tax=Nephila pilipes TaxID=299642 RepID=A0A8X6UGX5_NEPPI|nr:hypothetical protein NPIL_77231 [Nephila pilipes]
MPNPGDWRTVETNLISIRLIRDKTKKDHCMKVIVFIFRSMTNISARAISDQYHKKPILYNDGHFSIEARNPDVARTKSLRHDEWRVGCNILKQQNRPLDDLVFPKGARVEGPSAKCNTPSCRTIPKGWHVRICS